MWYSIIQIKVNNYYSSSEDILFDLLINTYMKNKVESTQQKSFFILLFDLFEFTMSQPVDLDTLS